MRTQIEEMIAGHLDALEQLAEQQAFHVRSIRDLRRLAATPELPGLSPASATISDGGGESASATLPQPEEDER